MHAVESGSIKKGEKTVVVLRYLGPKGGPGACFILPLFFLYICAWLLSLVFQHYPLSHTHTLLLCLYEAITLPSLTFPTTTRYLFCFSILLFESGVPNLTVDRLTERTLTRSRPASFFSSHGGPDWLERHTFRTSPPYIHPCTCNLRGMSDFREIRHAGDAQAHESDHGRRSRSRRRLSHGRKV